MIQGFSSGLLGNRELIYETDLPSFQRDFASLKTLDHGYGPSINFTRASNATYFDVDGVLQTAGNNVPRFDHDPADGGKSLGLLIEEARTNSIRNSQAGGSTNGVIGSATVPTPAFPTNWFASSHTGNGLNTEIIGTGTEDGLAYIDIKFSGTATSGSGITLSFQSQSFTTAADGQTWTGSAYVKLQAGSLTNVVATNIVVVGGNSGTGTSVAGQSTSTPFTPTSSTLRSQRAVSTRTFSSASVDRVFEALTIIYTVGNPIDLTLRIAAPQLEQGAFPTSYIPTTTAAATRSADSAVVSPISSFYNQSEGTLFAEAIASTVTGVGSGGASQHVAALIENISGNVYVGLYRQTSATNGRLFVGTSGGTQADISQSGFVSGASTKLIGALRQDDIALSVNGASTSTDTTALLPSPTSLRIGGLLTTGFLNGHIRKIAYWPKRLSNTLLQQLTT